MSVSRIAKASGVSKATVSRVLNGRPGVQSNNVKAVLDAARRLQYPVPAAIDDDLKAASRGAVTVAYLQVDKGLVADHATTGLMVYEGIAAAAVHEHVDLVCGAARDVQHLPDVVASGRADGLILAGMKPSHAVLAKLRRTPHVWVSSYRTEQDVYVLPGNEQVGTLALEYLRQRGHQQVAVLNPFSNHPALSTRSVVFDHYAGQRGLTSASVSLDRPFGDVGAPEYWNRMEDTLEELVKKAFAGNRRPTGLFVPVASVVTMAYRVLRQQGIEPDHDVELVTCGGEEEVMCLYPRPGIVDIAPHEMGRRALAAVLDRIKAPKVDHRSSIFVEPRVVPGESFRGDRSWPSQRD